MTRISIALILCLVFAFSAPSSGTASPQRQSSTVLIRVCYDQTSCDNPTPLNTTPATTLSGYTQQVLANEWHGQADIEALKAGAIAIRTFSYREIGCFWHKSAFDRIPSLHRHSLALTLEYTIHTIAKAVAIGATAFFMGTSSPQTCRSGPNDGQ